ncbi:MAG: hypothetical protein LC808_13875, partial [Actinobacteria bacterium]|nr:hypothetical protein [Actinomycetota bacterium]
MSDVTIDQYGELYRALRSTHDTDPANARTLIGALTTDVLHHVRACAQAEQHDLYDVLSERIESYGPGHPDFEAAIDAELEQYIAAQDEALAHLDPYTAVDCLFRHRHQLANDTLRTLQGVWSCASAARFGEPYEDFIRAESIAAHNTAECEDDTGHPENGPGHLIAQFHDETGLLNVYQGNPDAIDDTEDVLPFLAWIAADPERTQRWE